MNCSEIRIQKLAHTTEKCVLPEILANFVRKFGTKLLSGRLENSFSPNKTSGKKDYSFENKILEYLFVVYTRVYDILTTRVYEAVLELPPPEEINH